MARVADSTPPPQNPNRRSTRVVRSSSHDPTSTTTTNATQLMMKDSPRSQREMRWRHLSRRRKARYSEARPRSFMSLSGVCVDVARSLFRAPTRQMRAVSLDLPQVANHLAASLRGLIAWEHRRRGHGRSISGVGRTG